MNTFPCEMYKANQYRVVHGPEEQAAFEKTGWSTAREEGKEYAVHTANAEAPKKVAPKAREAHGEAAGDKDSAKHPKG